MKKEIKGLTLNDRFFALLKDVIFPGALDNASGIAVCHFNI